MKRSEKLGVLLAVFLPSSILADDSVEHNYLYRSNVMEISAKHLKALQGYVKGELAIKKHIPAHVDGLLAMNAMNQDLFPAGEQHPESEALPAIWSDPRGFRQANEYNRQRIMALKEIDPSDMGAMKRAVNQVRMSCGDCHSYYRER